MATSTHFVQSNGNASTRAKTMRVFTDMPSFTCPFTSSPSICTPNETSPPASPPKYLAFPKQPIAHSSCSTDSEILSDFDSRVCSPSLLTSLFLRNPSSSCSTSTSDHMTPLTPTSSRPILRRPDCTSTSTSASEDCGRLGLDPSTARPDGGLSRKSSTLTFAVKCPITSDSAHSPMSSFCRPTRNYSRSPARLPTWNLDEDDEEEDDDEDEEEEEYRDFCSPLFEEGSESDDEGYQEDSEGGFTDDEDHVVGTLTGLPRTHWVPSARWTATQASAPRRRTAQDTSLPTSDDGSVIYQPRGRKVSIATTKPDRCSRHVSPPPSRASSPPPPCPPAARSPSAIGLCRRRQTSDIPMAASKSKGWRSDDPAFGRLAPPSRSSSMSASAHSKMKMSCPPPSILRHNISQRACKRIPESTSLKLTRRVSAPACSNIVVARSGSDRDMGCGAKEGLQAFLRRGSERRPVA